MPWRLGVARLALKSQTEGSGSDGRHSSKRASNGALCMDVEKNIADIAFLEELYTLPDERPNPTSGGQAARPKQEELYGRNLWLSANCTFRLMDDDLPAGVGITL